MENNEAIVLKQVGIQFTQERKRRLPLGDLLLPFSPAYTEKKKFWALRDIDFRINKGEHVGIIGQNGAGKSTLLKLISQIYVPTEGTIQIQGKVVPILELAGAFESQYTGRENIYLYGAIMGYSHQYMDKCIDEIIEFSELERFIDTPVISYSSGMKSRLGFSIATTIQPDILVLDEVLSTGDRKFQEKSFNRIMNLINEDTTVLFVSHNENSLKKICNRGILLNKGRLVADGKLEDIINQYVSTN